MAKNRVFRVGCQPNLKIFWNSDLLMGPLIMARRKVMEHFFRGKKPFQAQWPESVRMIFRKTFSRSFREKKI